MRSFNMKLKYINKEKAWVIDENLNNYHIENELIKQWLSEGNTPEPEFTEAELTQQAVDKKIAEAKTYLASTDFKMTVDYYQTMTAEQQEELSTKRSEARTFLKEQGL